MPPIGLIRTAVAAVWLYEGLWCKLLGGQPRELAVVQAVPYLRPSVAARLLHGLGVVEVGLGLWALSGWAAVPCAAVQTLLLVALNAGGLRWARHLIHDPGGMVVKNLAFLVLAWVAAGLPSR